uniref:CLAVATA3/ESR (CLE)-related protein 13 n=1 Tax=Nelumbo nucifera TaxID=4432 RepID=A0A822Z175_NELNU|nr:TPA_asm: hypothetical protein HUJ06_005878 [Nelumbo nucifera]
MSMRIPHLLGVILWLSLLLLLVHEFNNFMLHNYSITHLSVSHHHHHTGSTINRKMLSSKFDFTPFQRRLRQRHHRRHSPQSSSYVVVQPEPTGSEIDPLYGVEKRRVPTGPNPLHH